jgi:hypothetical protein
VRTSSAAAEAKRFYFFVTLITAYAVNPDPPATRLIGKSPEYTGFYVATWKDRTKHQRVRHAWIGLGITAAAMVGGSILCHAVCDRGF